MISLMIDWVKALIITVAITFCIFVAYGTFAAIIQTTKKVNAIHAWCVAEKQCE